MSPRLYKDVKIYFGGESFMPFTLHTASQCLVTTLLISKEFDAFQNTQQISGLLRTNCIKHAHSFKFFTYSSAL